MPAAPGLLPSRGSLRVSGAAPPAGPTSSLHLSSTRRQGTETAAVGRRAVAIAGPEAHDRTEAPRQSTSLVMSATAPRVLPTGGSFASGRYDTADRRAWIW